MALKSIDRIFWDAARIGSADERNAYLDRACEGDCELRRRVEQLLEAKAQAESFLESPALHLAAMAHERPVSEGPGTIIGPYKLLEQIGEGGFGIINTLGAAFYRAGRWQDTLVALEKSMELRTGGDSGDWFFLAMAHWQLGNAKAARYWYDQAVEWMDKNMPGNKQLRRFRAEAAALLSGTGPEN
jgi:uncharacterized protein HemY